MNPSLPSLGASELKTNEVGPPNLRTPVFTYKSQQDGPRVSIVAGLHGDEWYGIAAALALLRSLQHTRLFGTLTIIPAANLPAILGRTRESLVSPGDLNRSFKHSSHPEDSQVEELASELWEAHLADSDFLVDIHSGGRHRIVPHARLEPGNPEAEHLVKLLSLRYAMYWRPFPRGLLVQRAHNEGIPAIALEEGSGYDLRPTTLSRLQSRLSTLLGNIGTLDKITAPGLDSPFFFERGTLVKAQTNGLYFAQPRLRQFVSAGDVLGQLQKFDPSPPILIRSPINGTVFSQMSTGPVMENELLTEIIPGSLDRPPADLA